MRRVVDGPIYRFAILRRRLLINRHAGGDQCVAKPGEATPRTDKTCFRPMTGACARSSSLDRAHPARSYARMDAPDHERAGCARSNDHDLARLRLGPARPVFVPRREHAPGHPHWTARILRAHTPVWMRPIMSAQDARGPMIMIGQGYASARPGRSSPGSALEIRRVC